MTQRFTSVDEYVTTFPADVQQVLQTIRRTIKRLLPDSGETISYQIPTVTLDGRRIISFSAWKQHIGMYPVPDGDAALAADMAPYRTKKSTLQFPYRKPIPYELIGRVVAASAGPRRTGGGA